MKKVQTYLVLALATVALTACNTIQGAGEDLQAGGKAIEKAAKKS